MRSETQPSPKATTEYSVVRYGEIEVCWLPELEGGGRGFGQDYLPMVEHLFGHVGRVFELCAGAGCIGFSLLAHGLCDSLALSDINPVAVEAARETVRRNGLDDKVAVHLSDGLAQVPAGESCDLFVANPPFFTDPRVSFLREPWVPAGAGLRSMDPGLKLHRRLYEDLGRFLRPGGSALIQGCSAAQPPQAILPLVEAGGLRHIHTFWQTQTRLPYIYYTWSKRLPASVASDPPVPGEVEVVLREPAREPVRPAADGVHRLVLRNGTGRPLAVDMEMTATSHARPLTEMPSEGEIELPAMALGADRAIVFRDEASGSPLATVEPAAAPR